MYFVFKSFYGRIITMTITNWRDLEKTPHYLRDDFEAYSMPFIVRVEKDKVPSHEEVIDASVKAFIAFLDDERASSGIWSAVTSEWLKGRIRKVSRRARGAAWDKAVALGGIVASSGNAEVLVLPPHPVDAIPAEIKKLQVSGLDLEKTDSLIKHDTGLMISLNPDVTISTGKTVAQVCHAVQVAVMNADVSTLENWKANDFLVSFVAWDSDLAWSAEIQDAGFTEIAPGTVTAKAAFL